MDSSSRVHGGIAVEELEAFGCEPSKVIDFSVNVNCYGPAPTMVEAIRAADVRSYPDPREVVARRALARWAEVEVERVVLGNGAAELLWALARVLVPRTGGRVLVVEPTFSEFGVAVAASGGEVVTWRAPLESGFRFDLQSIMDAIRSVRPIAVYLCNPNNPNGCALAADELTVLARRMEGTLLLLDEAFLSLSMRWRDAHTQLPENVVRIRSLTKDHALPGLRVGYLVAPCELAERLVRNRSTWATGAGVQQAAKASVDLDDFIEDSRTRLLADTAELRREFLELGFEVLPSDTIYQLVNVGDAASLRRELLSGHQLLIRDCASFGLPQFARVGARPERDRVRLREALMAIFPDRRLGCPKSLPRST